MRFLPEFASILGFAKTPRGLRRVAEGRRGQRFDRPPTTWDVTTRRCCLEFIDYLNSLIYNVIGSSHNGDL